MFAQCPSCQTVFRVSAAHLKVAAGTVRCGACGQVFNALATLIDDLPPSASPEPPELNDIEAPTLSDTSLGAIQPEPELELMSDRPEPIQLDEEGDQIEAETSLTDLDLASIDAAHDSADQQVDFAAVEAGDELPAWDIGDDEQEQEEARALVTSADAEASRDQPETVHHEIVYDNEDSDLADEIPLALRGAEGRRRSARGGLWVTGSVLLILLAVLQLVWFRHGWVTAQLPEARPLIGSLCELLTCPQPKATSAQSDSPVRLYSRDVRYHPGLEATLLVNATLNNQGEAAEPYPVLELSLFDTNGGLIGIRRFQPRDYLDSSIDPAIGIEPGQPVHIVLEIAATEQNAVSFEFRFL
jgi:predicted Zn finger-like uncharacterized protein